MSRSCLQTWRRIIVGLRSYNVTVLNRSVIALSTQGDWGHLSLWSGAITILVEAAQVVLQKTGKDPRSISTLCGWFVAAKFQILSLSSVGNLWKSGNSWGLSTKSDYNKISDCFRRFYYDTSLQSIPIRCNSSVSACSKPTDLDELSAKRSDLSWASDHFIDPVCRTVRTRVCSWVRVAIYNHLKEPLCASRKRNSRWWSGNEDVLCTWCHGKRPPSLVGELYVNCTSQLRSDTLNMPAEGNVFFLEVLQRLHGMDMFKMCRSGASPDSRKERISQLVATPELLV